MGSYHSTYCLQVYGVGGTIKNVLRVRTFGLGVMMILGMAISFSITIGSTTNLFNGTGTSSIVTVVVGVVVIAVGIVGTS